jgi:hypothetical protein
MLERPGLSEELVNDAMERARLRAAIELPDGSPLSDEVIESWWPAPRRRRRSPGPAGCWRS